MTGPIHNGAEENACQRECSDWVLVSLNKDDSAHGTDNELTRIQKGIFQQKFSMFVMAT